MPPPPTITIEEIIEQAVIDLNEWTDAVNNIIKEDNANGIKPRCFCRYLAK